MPTLVVKVWSRMLSAVVFALIAIAAYAQVSDDAPPRPGTLRFHAQEARGKGLRELTLPADRTDYTPAPTVSSALARLTLLSADLIDRAIAVSPDGDSIVTWYKFRIVDLLSRQPSTEAREDLDEIIPDSLKPIAANEFVVPQSAGTLAIDGITIHVKGRDVDNLQLQQRHLLFIHLDASGRVGLAAAGPEAIYRIVDQDSIVPVSERKSALAEEIRLTHNNFLTSLRRQIQRQQ